jgi:hypothetical protein
VFLLRFAVKRKCGQNAVGDTFFITDGVAEFTIFYYSISAKISCQPLLHDEILHTLNFTRKEYYGSCRFHYSFLSISKIYMKLPFQSYASLHQGLNFAYSALRSLYRWVTLMKSLSCSSRFLQSIQDLTEL